MRKFANYLILFLVSASFVFGETLHFEDEIVVKGEAVAKTATVTTLTAKQIEKKGASNVAEALSMVPGVYIKTGGKGEAYVMVRGLLQKEVAILINGLPVSSPYDGQVDLSNIPVDSIEKIEVVKGAASVLYGANAMGGVINIITKKSNGASKVVTSGEVGSGIMYKGTIFVEGKILAMRYLAMVSKCNRDYYPLPSDYQGFKNQLGTKRENSDKNSLNSMLTFGFDGKNNSRHTFSINSIDMERGFPLHESSEKVKYWRFTDWNKSGFDWVYEKEFKEFSIKSKLFYDSYKNTLDSYDDDSYLTQIRKKSFTSKYDDYDLGGDIFVRKSFGLHKLLKFAFRMRHDNHKEQKDVGMVWKNYKSVNYSIPVEFEFKTDFNWTVVTGVSLDFMEINEFANVDKHTESEVNPQVAVLVPIKNSLSFKTSLSKKTRFPTLQELFSSHSGNPNLNSMNNTIFEAGIEFAPIDGMSLSFVAYSNRVTDLIYRTNKYEPYENIDKASFNGFETELFYFVNEKFIFNFAYSYLSAKDKSTNQGMYIEYKPKNKVDVSMDFVFPKEIKCSLSGSYTSSQFYYDDDLEKSLDSYTVVNVRVYKDFGKSSMFIQLRNLFDQLYYESEGFPLAGRTITAGFKYVF